MLDDLIDINDPALLTTRLSEERAPDIVEALNEATPERAVALLDGVSADRLADIFRALEEPTRANLLGKLDADTTSALRELLT